MWSLEALPLVERVSMCVLETASEGAQMKEREGHDPKFLLALMTQGMLM